MEGISFMKANAQRNFGLSAILALAVVSLSGCVTSITLDSARTYKEYRWEEPPNWRWVPVTREAAWKGTPVTPDYKKKAAGKWAPAPPDPKDKAAYEAQLARLEEEGKIRHADHQGNPGYYALVPLAVAADIALVPGYIIYAARHLRNPD